VYGLCLLRFYLLLLGILYGLENALCAGNVRPSVGCLMHKQLQRMCRIPVTSGIALHAAVVAQAPTSRQSAGVSHTPVMGVDGFLPYFPHLLTEVGEI
jgi:hypothetical protein